MHAHEPNSSFCDIKMHPGNILVSEDGQWGLLFGLLQALES